MSIAILISEAFFSTMSVCLFMIVECGVPLAHSTTHDIYNDTGPFFGLLPLCQNLIEMPTNGLKSSAASVTPKLHPQSNWISSVSA